MSGPRLRALLALLAMATACRKAKPEEVATTAAVPVQVAAAHLGTLTAYVQATGTVDPAPGADWTVTAPGPARIAQITGAPGDMVRRGTVVVRFDSPPLRSDLATRASELSQAQARLENARKNHQRLAELLEKGIASRKEVEDARKDLLDAEAAVHGGQQTRAAAADLVSRASPTAPFDGMVAQRWHNPGDLVDVNEHVVRLVDPRRLQVTAAVPVGEATRIVVGHAARVTVPGGSADTEMPARVVGAPAAVDPVTGSAPVRLTLQGTLPVGTPVQVQIVAEERTSALIVPASAVVREEDKAAVFVVGPDSKAQRRAVTLGLESGDEVQVLSGLKEGERVVIKGQEELPDGATVTIDKG